jgi:glycosyltransferase involved in cell wall biosynthesis
MASTSNKIIISVVICTFNRSLLLQKCLESLANQHFPVNKFEVIVVDNCSSDDTDAVIQKFTTNHKHFRCVLELNLGLSFARNRGWKEAVGEYVAFIDDDAIAHLDWIHQIALFINRHPQISVFGGPFKAFTMVQPPDWFPPEYGSFDYGITERPLVHNEEWINGSNMIFSKDILVRYGGFSEHLGMRGLSVFYGEDTSLIQGLMDAGVVVFYVPTIKVLHLLPEYKMNLKWLLMAHFRSGLNYGATFNKQLLFIDYIAIILKSLFRMVRSLFPPYKEPFKRVIYYVFAHLFFGYGTLCEKIHGLKVLVTRTK